MATVFEMIINGDIPSTKLYEDDSVLVILDINPIEKGHSLIISKTVYEDFTQCPSAQLSHMMEIAQRVALKLKAELKCDGTNILINQQRKSFRSGDSTPSHSCHSPLRKRRTEFRLFKEEL